jgi:chaperone modulatory protein CbpM
VNIQSIEAVWLNGNEVCRIDHLVEVSGLSIEEIEDLVDNDILAPLNPGNPPHSFALHAVLTVKMARRLRDDFQLEPHSLALTLTLLNRINSLEEELQTLRSRLGS